MKVTLDLDNLLQQRKITEQEYQRLQQLGEPVRAGAAFNLLLSFGLLAVTSATLALVPSPWLAAALGAVFLVAVGWVQRHQRSGWAGVTLVCLALGGVLFAGGLVTVGQGAKASFWLASAVLGATAVLAHSRLLLVFTLVLLGASVDAQFGRLEVAYWLGIRDPLQTLLLFAGLTAACWIVHARIAYAWQWALHTGRFTGLALTHYGCWLASLKGVALASGTQIADEVVSLAWLTLAVLMLWQGWRSRQSWLFHSSAAALAVNLYVQWFKHFGADPVTLLLAGIAALAFAVLLKRIHTQF